jgi:hypothetical protein
LLYLTLTQKENARIARTFRIAISNRVEDRDPVATAPGADLIATTIH